MTAPRIALVGTGRMGRAIRAAAAERDWPVAVEIGRAENAGGAGITRERLAGADVVIEFTAPEAAPGNAIACLRAGVPVVVGTTGWLAERERVQRAAQEAGGALFWAPNFSLGVNLFWRAAERLAALAASVPGFDAHIVETHHTAKRDAPSGTALELERRASAALGRSIATTSIRLGAVPGTHVLLLDGAYEQLRLEHVARDRRVFAEGALLAAAWLVRAVRDGRRGTFTMDDLLDTPGGDRAAAGGAP